MLCPLVLAGCTSFTSQVTEQKVVQQQQPKKISIDPGIKDHLVKIVNDSYGPGDKLLNQLLASDVNVDDHGSFSVITARYITPTSPIKIRSQVDNYCHTLKGRMNNGGCELSSDPDIIAFYYKLSGSLNSNYISAYDIDFYSIVPKNADQNDALNLAKEKGYVDSIQTAKQKSIDDKKAQELAKKKAEYDREIERQARLQAMQKASIDTRAKVLRRGTKVCQVSLDDVVVGYTEDAANGKVKVLVNNKLIWDWPDNWFACDR
ncbi:hypothetical protein [Vibrio viridaestus]|uniref:Uncharacterized protein n=1 Tax=Vibrio viridaestus TaxID=2487322 RepID=A0A3N9TGS7_9VIBR|nr:hypothetical protein [Vibrio viridaestus]RQW63487.1 hypothetical protein EES38_09575 [Vibrio viridaestus]